MPLQYDLKRLSSRKRVFVSLDSSEATCYEFETRSMKDAILSKPDVLIRQLHIAEPSKLISSIKFPTNLDDSGSWRPQISVKNINDDGQTMKLRNPMILRWTLSIDGIDCVWDLSFSPFVLTLRAVDLKDVLAVFTLRDRWAQGPMGNVGGLHIMDDKMCVKGKEDVICTLAGVLVYWERAGKMVYFGSDGWGM
ncbi:hypothetical protein BKA64DRAFT_687653 [Cadophora sp. MPI-SDFR-AT-0126]|nr:hypothetical protein BKA64DRAFT_687653 [Leotiomycetes sp. MPI-SDFR-AT-0126]